MNIKNKLFNLILICFLIISSALADDKKEKEDLLEEELPAVNPFLSGAGTTGSTADGLGSSAAKSSNSISIKNLKLSGVILSENKKFAIFSYPDGRTTKYEENSILSNNLMILDIFQNGIYLKMNEEEYSLDLNNNLIKVE